MDLHVSDLGHDLIPVGHRADAGPPETAVLLPGLDVLGAPPGMTFTVEYKLRYGSWSYVPQFGTQAKVPDKCIFSSLYKVSQVN